MANPKRDPLFDLIKSLTKTEKRHFRLFVNRSGNTEEVKFIKLFDAMEAMKTYDDVVVPQAGKNLSVKVGLLIGELYLFNAGHSL